MTKKRRIAILTIQKVFNYGAVLQSFALQKYLEEGGVETEIVDLIRDKSGNQSKDKSYLIIFLRKYIKKINQFRHYIINSYHFKDFGLKLLKRKNLKFLDFNKKKLTFTNNKYDNTNLIILNELFDAFLCGSDQIWNSSFEFDISPYLLGFVDDRKKKISLSASVGVDYIGDYYKNKFKKNIGRFNSISVREEQSKELISKYTDKDIDVLFDPVFLYNKKEWAQILDLESKINKKKYILCYSLGADDLQSIKIAKQILKLNEYEKIEIVKIGRHRNDLYYSDLNINWDVGPIDFINLLINAEFVVTNSFHGTAFSINFEKQFFSILNPDNDRNSRILNLLEKVQLKNRILYNESEVTSKKIDYKIVNTFVEKERSQLKYFVTKHVLENN